MEFMTLLGFSARNRYSFVIFMSSHMKALMLHDVHMSLSYISCLLTFPRMICYYRVTFNLHMHGPLLFLPCINYYIICFSTFHLYIYKKKKNERKVKKTTH